VTTETMQGAEVGLSSEEFTSSILCFVVYLHLCNHNFEREEESAEFKDMYSLRSPPTLIDTDRKCPNTPPCRTSACLSVCHAFEVRACAAPTISTAVEVATRRDGSVVCGDHY